MADDAWPRLRVINPASKGVYFQENGCWMSGNEFTKAWLDSLRGMAFGPRLPLVGVAVCAQKSRLKSLRMVTGGSICEPTEREHMARATAAIQRLAGERVLGWDSFNTRGLVTHLGGFEVSERPSHLDRVT